jgi:hypothetical protein
MDTSEIVIRDKNGEFEIGDPPMQSFDETEEGGSGEAEDESKRPKILSQNTGYKGQDVDIKGRSQRTPEIEGCGEAS